MCNRKPKVTCNGSWKPMVHPEQYKEESVWFYKPKATRYCWVPTGG